MDSDKGPVVFPLLTLGEVFHVKKFSLFFFCDYLLGRLFSWLHLLAPNRLNQQGKIFSIVFISQQVVSEPRLSTSLGPPGETGLSLLRPKARCVRERLLGYPTSVVEGVGDEFISVRESLIS